MIDSRYRCEACHDPAEFVGFGHPSRRTCKRHKELYVRLAGPSAQVSCWLPIAPAPLLSGLAPAEIAELGLTSLANKTK